MDPDLRRDAIARWNYVAQTVFAEDKSERDGLRVSDAGRCVLELWAELHGQFDIAESALTHLTRFDEGHLTGAWFACLLAAGVRKYVPPNYVIELEPEVVGNGKKGHIDFLLRDDRGAAVWVVDFKKSFWTKALEAPDKANPHQVLQTCDYAVIVSSPLFTVFTFGPAVQAEWNRKTQTRIEHRKHRQDDYDTAQFADDVARERERLEQALGDVPPVGDAREAYRCRSCKYSVCPRNTANRAEIPA